MRERRVGQWWRENEAEVVMMLIMSVNARRGGERGLSAVGGE